LKAAFAALQSHQPHVVLLDFQLGAEDGTVLSVGFANSLVFEKFQSAQLRSMR
jgi:hypothetical protein